MKFIRIHYKHLFCLHRFSLPRFSLKLRLARVYCSLLLLSTFSFSSLVKAESVLIKGFSINWATQSTNLQSLNYDKLLDQWLQELGPKLTIRDMQVIAARMTRELRKRGYQFHQVVLPKQELTNGILKLRIIEGKIGIIDVRDNKKYTGKWLKKPIEQLKEHTIFQPAVEEAIELINASPGLKVFSYYSRGSTLGTANVNIKVLSEEAFQGGFRVDNHGSERTGINRSRLNLAWNNPIGQADQLQLTLLSTLSTESNYLGAINYKLPSLPLRHSVNLHYAKNSFELQEDFSLLALSGVANTSRISYQYKGLHRQRVKRSVNLAVEHSTTKIQSDIEELQNTLNRREDTSSIRLDWRGFSINQKRRQSNSYLFGFKYGKQSQPSANSNLPNYRLFNFSLSLQKQLSKLGSWLSSNLNAQLYGQYTQDSLPAIERLGLTGVNAIQAVRPGLYSGDRGVIAYTSWQWLYFQNFKPGIFYTAAFGEQLRDKKDISHANLQSIGLSAEVSFKNWQFQSSYSQLTNHKMFNALAPSNEFLFLAQVTYIW